MKKLVISSVLASSILFPTLANAQNLSFPVKMTVEKKADIRRGATTSYAVVKTLNSGQEVTVIGEFTNQLGQKWYHVIIGKTKGWGLSSLFAPESDGVVTSASLNIRRGASIAYTTVGKLFLGTHVTVIDHYTNKSGELWYRVKYGNTIGWVVGKYLKTNFGSTPSSVQPSSAQKTVIVDVAYVRRGATTSYQSVLTLKKGQIVNILDHFTNAGGEKWYRVQYGQVVGWVISTSFDAPTSTNLSDSKSVIVDVAYVRRGATTSYQSVLTLKKGQIVSILDHFTNAMGEKWYRVQYGQVVGWVISTSFDTPTSTNQSDSKTVITDQAYILRGASSSYQSVATIEKGQDVYVIGSYSNAIGEKWYRVQYEEVTGWVISSAFEATQAKPTLYIGTKSAVLYSVANYKGTLMQKIPYYSKVMVLDETKDSSNQLWEKVETESGKIGWTPKFELVQSSNDLHYVYSFNGAVLRKGASATYGVTLTLNPNDKLITLQTFNDWINVETISGTRGWILESQTSLTPFTGLLSPTSTNNTLVWPKAENYKVSYSTVSSNQLKITIAGTTKVALPSFTMKGINAIQSQVSGSVTSILFTFDPGYTFTLRNYSDRLSLEVLPTGLLGKKIIVDAGHGGIDTGAIGPNGLKEKDVNLATALALKAELENAGAIVTLTRSTDVFVELDQRAAIANNSDADAFVSIHSDSFSTTSTGTTTYYNTTVNFNGPQSVVLAGDVEDNLTSALHTYKRGIKEQDYRVLKQNELPSILVELAYISNPKEEALLNSNDFREKAAFGIRKGLEEYFSGL